MKRAALERALRIYEPPDLRAFARELESLEVGAFVVASYGRILPNALLSIPAFGALNVHPSLLPRYRGATPIQAALLAGDRESGVTIMLMDEGMDTGEVVLQERVAIEDAESYGSLHDRLAALGATMLVKAFELAERDGAFPHRPQEGTPSVTRPIKRADLEIDWRWSAQRIVNHVRAYSPQPAARAELCGVTVKVLQAHVSASDTVEIDRLIAPNHGVESGTDFARRMSTQ